MDVWFRVYRLGFWAKGLGFRPCKRRAGFQQSFFSGMACSVWAGLVRVPTEAPDQLPQTCESLHNKSRDHDKEHKRTTCSWARS